MKLALRLFMGGLQKSPATLWGGLNLMKVAAVGFHCAFLNSAIGFLKRGRPRHATTAAGSPASK